MDFLFKFVDYVLREMGKERIPEGSETEEGFSGSH